MTDPESSNLAVDEIPIKRTLDSVESESWIAAIATEVKSILKNDTFDLLENTDNYESDTEIVGSRFVLKNKLNENRDSKKKARLIA
ncbi:hypothetical protein JTE90_020191 [Oedothorax gibbosus]|uniref:Gag-pol polyprotein n=1 Tax=Oedothorax gibbosus TaxID=931172 RepID=A0AAV6U2Z5_9ARAC|nr:hypothetical protein JTE90_020191 [Oedothorax gibbosus]